MQPDGRIRAKRGERFARGRAHSLSRTTHILPLSLSRLVFGRGPKVFHHPPPACVCMRESRERVSPLRVDRNGDRDYSLGRIRDDGAPNNRGGQAGWVGTVLLVRATSYRSSPLLPRNITNELNGLRSATRSYLNGNPGRLPRRPLSTLLSLSSAFVLSLRNTANSYPTRTMRA